VITRTDVAFYEFIEKSQHTRKGRAISLALQYGQIDEAHHKTWVIDQMLRELLGDTGYEEAIALYENDSEYKWDTGIAP